MDTKEGLYVRMFGGLSIEVNGRPVSLGKRSRSRFIQLFLILLLHPEGITKNKLFEALYDWEELENKNNSLNTLIYRLRKYLVSAGLPEGEYIEVKGGICIWKTDIRYDTDAAEFERCYSLALHTEKEEEKLTLFTRMWELYSGELLPGLMSENWVIMENIRLKNRYSDIVRELGKYLKNRREYERMLSLYEKAASLYPFEGWQEAQLETLMLLARYGEAYELYKETVKRYSEELGLPPSGQMLSIFQAMREKMVKPEDNFCQIQDELEKQYEMGAYYCDYPSFLDTCNAFRRLLERNGQDASFASCTLTQLKSGAPKKNRKQIGEWLGEVICANLRRSDLCTRYSRNQYLMLLMGMKPEDSRVVERRIENAFFKNPGSEGYHLEFRFSDAGKEQPGREEQFPKNKNEQKGYM